MLKSIKKSTKNARNINKYSNLDKYLEENCAYGCRYFVVKKVNG